MFNMIRSFGYALNLLRSPSKKSPPNWGGGRVQEVGRVDNCPYMALEYVDGGSLAQKLAGTPLPATQVAPRLETLAQECKRDILPPYQE